MRPFVCLLALTLVGPAAAEDKIFSGPQPGEKMAPFKVRGVLDPDAGKDLDFLAAAKGKPVVLVFVHDLNRQSISMVRALTSYTKSRAKDGLTTGVVWLADDVSEAETTIKRIKHALTEGVPIGVSPEGREGPGSYGLNRKVTLTILVGNQDKVTANFPLVQPSLQADLPKVLDAVVKEVGGKAPKLEEIEGAMPGRKEPARKEPGKVSDEQLRSLLGPVIRLDATPEDVEKAAKAVEEAAAKDPAVKAEIGVRANRIVNGGKLKNYGTSKAQEYLQKWAKEYGPAKGEESPRKKP